MDDVKACRIPAPQLEVILRALGTQMPNMAKMLKAHIKALEEELLMTFRGHELKPNDPVEEGIARSRRGKE